MGLYQQFQEGSTTTKVVSIVLLVGVIGAIVCGCGLLAWFLLTGGGSDTVAGLATPPVAFVTPIPPAPPPPEAVEFSGWRGEYYDNPEPEGEPVTVRDDERIDFDWDCQPPTPGLPPENFSVRWTISRDVPAGIYRVDVNVNDGIRLWVDDVLILDEWRTGPTRTLSAAVNLVAGTHNIRLEYFNAECPSLIQATARYLQNFPATPQPDQPPIPVIVALAKASVGDVVTFDASQSVCANLCVSLAWNFGDGSTANAVRVQHVYLSPANYNVTLTLTDDKGLQGTGNTVIKIGEAKPTATPEPGATDTPVPTVVPTDVPTLEPLPTEPPEEIRPDASFSINPPQAEVGQEVVFDAGASAGGSSPIQTYEWNFGDGSPTQETGDPVIAHVYGNSGGFQIVLNVINMQGLNDNMLEAILVTKGEQPGETPEVELPIAPTDTPSP